jgi:hypothetical protein
MCRALNTSPIPPTPSDDFVFLIEHRSDRQPRHNSGSDIDEWFIESGGAFVAKDELLKLVLEHGIAGARLLDERRSLLRWNHQNRLQKRFDPR